MKLAVESRRSRTRLLLIYIIGGLPLGIVIEECEIVVV